jgi:hypothetical protein
MKVRAIVAGLIGAFTWRLVEGMKDESAEGELLGKDEFSVAFGECWVQFAKI